MVNVCYVLQFLEQMCEDTSSEDSDGSSVRVDSNCYVSSDILHLTLLCYTLVVRVCYSLFCHYFPLILQESLRVGMVSSLH